MLKNMSKKMKVGLGIVAAVIVFGILGAIGGGGKEAPEAAPTTTAAPVPVESAETPTPEPVRGDAPVEDSATYAQGVYDAWLESRGATSQAEVLAQSPGNVQGYLVSAESPVTGTVVFTAQMTKSDVSKVELEQGAMAVLQLVGFEDETLERVEIVTADSLVRGVANRRDAPLLNQ